MTERVHEKETQTLIQRFEESAIYCGFLNPPDGVEDVINYLEDLKLKTNSMLDLRYGFYNELIERLKNELKDSS